MCLFNVDNYIEMPIVPQSGSAKYKLECEVCIKMKLLSILFTEFLKALQTVFKHACQKKIRVYVWMSKPNYND